MRSRLVLAAAAMLLAALVGCPSVHEATPTTCPDDQRPRGGECICIATDALPVDGSCPPIEIECNVADCVDDDNPCTEPTCPSAAGTCTNEPVADDTSCEDGSLQGVCVQGECVPPPWELGTAFRIAEATEEISTPLIAAAADGRAMALWSDGDQVRASSFDPAAGWDDPVVVEPEHVPSRGIALGMDAAGNAVALYTRLQQGAVELVVEGYDQERGAWDSFAILSEPAAVTDSPQVSVTPGGEAVAVWWEGPNDIVMARGRSDSMAWDAPEVVSLDDGLQKTAPFVSLDADGEGGIVYRASWPAGDSSTESVWVVSVGPESTGLPTRVSDEADWVRDARIAAGASGDLVAIWEEVNDLMHARFADGAWGLSGAIEEATPGVDSPAVTADGTGDFHVAWLQDGDARTRRFVSADAAWDPVRVLLVSTTENARAPSLAAPPNGDARVSWPQDQHVRLSRFEGDSGWGAFERVSSDLESPASSIAGPRLGIAADGTEVVVWAEGLEIWTWADRPD